MLNEGERWRVATGEALDVMRSLPGDTADSVVTDPPAGISFMGKDWDTYSGKAPSQSLSPAMAAVTNTAAFRKRGRAISDTSHEDRRLFVSTMAAIFRETLRVLKPGGHALVWSLPRTSHWTAWALEDAGFEIRDSIHHLFGTGFPKDKLGALKPAHEVWWLVRKPVSETSVAANVAHWGTGAINVDACRVGTGEDRSSGGKQGSMPQPMSWGTPTGRGRPSGGRWPPNLLLTHAPGCGPVCADGCPIAELDRQSGVSTSPKAYVQKTESGGYGGTIGKVPSKLSTHFGDTGGASRFFPVFRYTAKPSRAERRRGLTDDDPIHPTVKGVDLMRWLVKLVTPPGGIVLDPFAGTGTTGMAAVLEGMRFFGVERDAAYADMARRRIAAWSIDAPASQYPLFTQNPDGAAAG